MVRGYTANKEQLTKSTGPDLAEDVHAVQDDRRRPLHAIRAAIDKVAPLGLLDAHARHCLIGQGDGPTDPDGQVAELMGAVGRMMSR